MQTRILCRLWAAVLLSLSCATVPPALDRAAKQLPPELRQAMQARDQAITKADPSAWDHLTADDFTVVNETGAFMTKAERLAQVRTQKATTPITAQQEQIRLYGDVAIRRFLSGDLWVLDVWVREARGWRVAAVQLTPVKK